MLTVSQILKNLFMIGRAQNCLKWPIFCFNTFLDIFWKNIERHYEPKINQNLKIFNPTFEECFYFNLLQKAIEINCNLFLNNIFITQNFVTKIVSELYNSIWDSILKRTIKFYGIVNFCDFWNFSIISLRQKIFNVLFDNNCSYKICYKIGKSSLGTKRQIIS